MLEIKNLSIEVDFRTIVKDFNLIVHPGDKVAIIGEEGNGKSTLLKAIYDTRFVPYARVTGSIHHNLRIGYLEQMLPDDLLEKQVQEYLFYNLDDYYDKVSSFYHFSKQLGLDDHMLEQRLRHLSGGEKVKVQILKLLLDDPDILLLDEPTNDLDIKTLNWLEQFINTTNKPILYVSHDEYLLEHTANVIVHLELIHKKMEARSTVKRVGYLQYVSERLSWIQKETQVARKEKQVREKQEAKLNQIKNKVEYQLRTITRKDPHGARLLKKKMKNVKAQERRFDHQSVKQVPDVEEAISLFFDAVSVPKQKEILKLNLDGLMINGNVIAKSVNLTIKGPEHLVIIGENGVGKTSLMRLIYDLLKNRQDIKVGYMPQNYDDILNNDVTPIQFLEVTGDQDEVSLHRSYLGNLRFTKEEMINPIRELSGGSKAKLILLKLIIEQCNVLLLDEPTRNVSPLTGPVIRRMLKNYGGTIISVSHDRKYIEEAIDRVYELTKNGLMERLDKNL